jgi:membrane-bound metal-dependent hydrolase YbcI (DUF457 family)
MDSLTHGLASFAITRTFFPRATRATIVGAVVGGAVADLDAFSAYFGPASFLAWNRTYTHSIIGVFLIAAVSAAAVAAFHRNRKGQSVPFLTMFLPIFCASALHLVMDLCQSEGVELFWPFQPRRFFLDWVAHLDLWIFAILLVGVLLPRLLGLVTEEIGAKAKGPRGRVGAAFSLLIVLLYISSRVVLHGNAAAVMGARTYRGELPRSLAAFPESGSPFHWHGIVETERALHELDVDVGPGSSFDPDSGVTSYKPESSPALDAARNTEAARQFLLSARFPKATVEKTGTGYRVELRGFPYRADSRSGWRVVAIVETDLEGKILTQQIAWDQLSRTSWWR